MRGLTKEQLIASFQSGDSVWVHTNKRHKLMATLVHDTFLQSGLVVDHKDKLCVFHAMPTGWYKTSRAGEPEDQIVLERNGWTAIVEPVEKFVEIEGERYGSWFKLLRTKRPIRFALSIVDQLKRVSLLGPLHENVFTGLYLSRCGRLPPTPHYLPHAFHYTPKLFEKELFPKEIVYGKVG